MWRVWSFLLTEAQAQASPEEACDCWRLVILMPWLWEAVQRKWKPYSASESPLWREALQMWLPWMRQKLHSQLQLQGPRETSPKLQVSQDVRYLLDYNLWFSNPCLDHSNIFFSIDLILALNVESLISERIFSLTISRRSITSLSILRFYPLPLMSLTKKRKHQIP